MDEREAKRDQEVTTRIFLDMLPFTETGTMFTGDGPISVRLISEAMAGRYDVRVLEEREDYLKIRFGRFHVTGAVFPFPHPSMELWLDRRRGQLTYHLVWPDYWVLLPLTLLLLYLDFQESPEVVFPVVLGGASLLIFMDNRSMSREIRNVLKKITGSSE